MADRTLTSYITEKEAGQTVRTYLQNVIGLSAHQVSRQKYKKRGICVNEEPSYVNRILEAGDKLELLLPADRTFRGTEGAKPVKIWDPPAAWLSEYPLDILYEDEDLLIVNKPAGIVCHPSPGHYADTLANQAAEHLGGIGSQMDIRITGRLDQETSGVVTIAKNQVIAGMIQQMREGGRIHKTYVALAQGSFAEDIECGEVDKPLRREFPGSHKMIAVDKTDPHGKTARTFWKVVRRIPERDDPGNGSPGNVNPENGASGDVDPENGEGMPPRTLLTCQIEHGRTHQIRVHMASIGHPLVGDPLYGEAAPGQQLATHVPVHMGLHAWKVSFTQPLTGREIVVEAPLPVWAQEMAQDTGKR